MSHPEAYPRPDFQRPSLCWQSLNGPWDFLFDDDDIGLASQWHANGLPESVTLQPRQSRPREEGSTESQAITQKIVGGMQQLFQDNDLGSADAAATLKKHKKTQIQVPFVFQCPASGVHKGGVHEVLWYERLVTDPQSQGDGPGQGDGVAADNRVLVRFGAVDYQATVWVNGIQVGSHRGGHVPFEVDITEALTHAPETGSADHHRLTVRVYDSAYDLTQPRGKQYWGAKPESIWYTPSGGIWQNVWVESVPRLRVADSSHGTILKSHDIKSGKVRGSVAVLGRLVGQACSVEVRADYAGVVVSTSERRPLPKETDRVAVEVDVRLSERQRSELPQQVLHNAGLSDQDCWRDGVALWSPEHPQLYDLTIILYDDASGQVVDKVCTQTGMRSLHWTGGDGHWRLNDKPYFQALCLDQGYWPDTFMTPPSQEALVRDIKLAKQMGMNGCRKHQKVEDAAFYYWADKLGYLVWAEMASAYKFSAEYVERFDAEWMESVRLAVNHPSVVTWTPVNESWGYTDLKGSVEQRNHIRSLYYMTKTLDDTRSINDNCGWEHVLTDLTTFHDYADGPELEKTCASLDSILGLKAGRDMFVGALSSADDSASNDVGASHRQGMPILCTEFGGVNIAAHGDRPEAREDSEEQVAEDWGYTTAKNSEDLLARVERLIKGVTKGGLVGGFVYTQLTDIEQEANGLYSFDRREKLDARRVKKIVEEAMEVYYKTARQA